MAIIYPQFEYPVFTLTLTIGLEGQGHICQQWLVMSVYLLPLHYVYAPYPLYGAMETATLKYFIKKFDKDSLRS